MARALDVWLKDQKVAFSRLSRFSRTFFLELENPVHPAANTKLINSKLWPSWENKGLTDRRRTISFIG
jgi:hypothetical protein